MKGVLDVPLPFKERQAVLGEFMQRYRKARKREKSILLDEVTTLLNPIRNDVARALRKSQRRWPQARRLVRSNRGRPAVVWMRRIGPSCGANISFASIHGRVG